MHHLTGTSPLPQLYNGITNITKASQAYTVILLYHIVYCVDLIVILISIMPPPSQGDSSLRTDSGMCYTQPSKTLQAVQLPNNDCGTKVHVAARV